MKLFKFTDNAPQQPTQPKESYQSFSTPFGKIGNGNLALPFVDTSRVVNNHVWFGRDDLFPQIITQMYYTSPMHSSIVNFKKNAVLGGGYELVKDAGATLEDDVYLRSMNIRLRIEKNAPMVLTDQILHRRVYFRVIFDDFGDFVRAEYVSADKVRASKEKDCYYINDDWSRGVYEIEKIEPYNRKNIAKKCRKMLYVWEDKSAGQDVYPIPSYTSAMNWIFLDGEMSTLQKEYIVNGIFPSYAISFPKKPQTTEEKEELKKTIQGQRGSGGAGKIWTFFGRGAEDLPKIDTIPVSNLDGAFQATTESIDSKICQAHTIDPILMGVRVSGKLGSGSDIKQAYTIFEKNVIMPLRAELEQVFNDLLKIAKAKGKFVVSKFEIINETIVQTENDKDTRTIDALNSMSPLLATKVLESMTDEEIRALAGLKPRKQPIVTPDNTTQQ
jgi:hypothetical protein